MENKMYVSTFDESGGYIVERWNAATQQYERFWPKEGFLPEMAAAEIAECGNYYYKER